MTRAATMQVQEKCSSSLISMTPTELLRVCAIAKNHAFLYAVPLTRVIDRVLDYSIRTAEAWELIDIEIDHERLINFQFDCEFCYWDSGFDEMILSLRYKNHEHDTTETLDIDILQMMDYALKEKSRHLHIESLEITQGKETITVEGKEISLKNGFVRIGITTDKPSN